MTVISVFQRSYGVLAVLVTIGTPSAANPARSAPVHARDQVVFVGDSITVGLGSDDPSNRSRPGLLRHSLGSDIDVVNLGVNGTTLAAIAENNPPMPQARHARNIVVILAGSNDLQVGAAANRIYPALRDFAVKLHRQRWSVAVGTILARSFPPDKERQRESLNTAIRSGELVRNGIAVLDYAAVQAAGDIPLADGIHPNDVGYEAMVREERPFLLKALHRR